MSDPYERHLELAQDRRDRALQDWTDQDHLDDLAGPDSGRDVDHDRTLAIDDDLLDRIEAGEFDEPDDPSDDPRDERNP